MDRPKSLHGDAAAAGEHYDRYIEAESVRLADFCPVEYAITRRYLTRYLPDGCVVAEIGVGAGHYSEFLARRGCRLHLVDVSAGLLDAARARLASAGLADSIHAVHLASATDLPLADASVDAILLLGPLYHLRQLEERRQAVREARRVLKPGGVAFAAGINRIAYLRDIFRSPDPFSAEFFTPVSASPTPGTQAFLAEYLAQGTLDPEHAPPIGYAHLTTIQEFRDLLGAQFEELALLGTESFTSAWQDQWKNKPPETRESWLDLIEATGTMVEGMAYSDHFLFVGR